MARWKITHTTITYAERAILDQGCYLADTEAELTWTYGTDTRGIVGSPRAILINRGNASGEFSLPVCRDYPTANAAFASMIEQKAWADYSPQGKLIINSEGHAMTYNAALLSLNTKITLAPKGYRVITEWTFALT